MCVKIHGTSAEQKHIPVGEQVRKMSQHTSQKDVVVNASDDKVGEN